MITLILLITFALMMAVQVSTPGPQALVLTAKETAKALAISPRKLWALTASGSIPHVKIGRCVRYPVADLESWIKQQKRGGASVK